MVSTKPENGSRKAKGSVGWLRSALEGELRSERWKIGERMPTERDFGTYYGVARNTVRRALDALEAEGLILRHVGRGTFRAGPSGHAATPAIQFENGSLSPADVMECRLIFEPELMSVAVVRATRVDLGRMADCLRGTDDAADLASFEGWDAALHDAFATATHNQAVIAMSRSLARVRGRTDWGQLKARSATTGRRSILQRQHHAMVEAIRQRDRTDARKIMREHILFVQKCMFDD